MKTIPEAQIINPKIHKDQCFSVTLKMKPEDQPDNMVQEILAAWNSDTPIKWNYELNPGGYAPPPKKEKSVYHKIRLLVECKKGKNYYYQLKERWFTEKHGFHVPAEQIHLKDLFTEEEAQEKLRLLEEHL